MGVSRGAGFAYLFERFPSFTQTFCFREVLEMRRQGVECPIWSIRDPSDEPRQDFPDGLRESTRYLPDSFEKLLATDAAFRRRARQAIGELRRLWGGEGEKRRVYEALWLLPRLRRQGIAHVHTHFAGTAARTAFWLNRLGGIRYSITAHANDIFCDEPSERLEMLIAEAACVVTVSDFSVRFLAQDFPAHAPKIHRVYNGIHPRRFRVSSPDASRPLILSVGRYIEKKGFADLVAACRGIEKDFECHIVGQGPLEAGLRAACAGDARIRIAGPKSEMEIIDLMARASVFALPCVDESSGGKDNLPTVIMEAMAAAVPVISTPIAGVPEMVEHGVTGLLVPPREPERLRDALGDLLSDPAAATAMGAAGHRVCLEKFATERTTEQLRTLLAEYRAFEPPQDGWLVRFFRK